MDYLELLNNTSKENIKFNFLANILGEKVENIILVTESSYFTGFSDISRLDDAFMGKVLKKITHGHLDVVDIYFQLFIGEQRHNVMKSISVKFNSTCAQINFIITFAEIAEIKHQILVLLKK